MANEGDGWAGSGAHPWHLDEETESILFLTNMGDEKSDIGFQVQSGGVHYYLTDLNLQPHETRAINLRKLRDAQKEDLHEKVIPFGATDGSVLWIRADNVPVMGRLVVLKRHQGMASNYDCYMCPCPANFESMSVTPSSHDMLPGQTKALVAIQVKRDCNFVPYYIDVTTSAAWWSDSLGVATVNAAGLVTAGQTGGSAHILAPITAYSYMYIPYVGCRACTLHPSAGSTIRTRRAKWAILYSDTGSVPGADCGLFPPPNAKWRNRYYYPYDNFGKISFQVPWILDEEVTASDCQGVQTGGSGTSASFHDVISICQTGCTFQSNQRFKIQGQWVRAQECVNKSEAECLAILANSDYVGWQVSASYNSVVVTPY